VAVVPAELYPPTTRTFRLGSSVAVCSTRGVCNAAGELQVLATIVINAVSVVEPIMAEIAVDPSDTPVTKPVVGPTVATEEESDVQLATLVTFTVVPSEYVPVAVSCLTIPTPESAGLGVIEIDSRTAGVTLNVVLPATDPDIAVMTAEPCNKLWTSPEPAVTVAMLGLSEVQLTLAVRSAVLVSLKVPVAVNCCVSPFGMPGESGVTVMDVNPLTNEIRAALAALLIK